MAAEVATIVARGRGACEEEEEEGCMAEAGRGVRGEEDEAEPLLPPREKKKAEKGLMVWRRMKIIDRRMPTRTRDTTSHTSEAKQDHKRKDSGGISTA